MFYLFKKLKTPLCEIDNPNYVPTIWLIDSNENKEKLYELPKRYFSKMIDEWMYAEGDFDINFTKKRELSLTDFEKKITKWIPE